MLSLIPNEHWDYDLGDTVQGLMTALSIRRGGAQSRIHIPGLGPCLPVRSGRAGIIVALKALGLRQGASVAVPLYCCPVVFRAIEAAGYHARFIDVDPNTYCLSPTDLAVKSADVDAVIAVHMFGNICDVRALREAIPSRPVIEDCAQSLGSCIDGRPAGSFGEMAVFSFRSGKYISAGEGGAVYCSNPAFEKRAADLIGGLAVPGHLDEVVHVVKTALRSKLRSKPLWGLLGSPLWSAYGEVVDYTSQAAIVMGQIYETDCRLSIARLAALASMIERHRANAEYYSRNLAVDAGMLCSEGPGTFLNRLQYPLLVPTSAQCDRLAERLRQDQISTARPHKDIVEIATTHYGYTGDCPQAERIAKTVLVIPCNYGLKAAEVERIAKCVNRAWKEIGESGGRIGMASISAGPVVPARTCNCESVAEPRHSS